MNVDIRNVSMSYGQKKRALTDVSIHMESPSLIGLVGPNGAGKSTLMKLLVSRLLPTSGSIAVDGRPIDRDSVYLRRRLGYLPQDFGLYGELTVYQFLDYLAALKDLGKGSRSAIERVISETNLVAGRNARIRTLSGGQRQRLGIAQAMLGSPSLLVLDEPTVGLDPEERVNFRNLFSKSARDKIVVLSTHIIDDVQSVCDRLIVIDKGVILFDGRPEALIRSAEGHVGTRVEANDDGAGLGNGNYRVTARLHTPTGIVCRIVGESLPPDVTPVEPSLEDAYMFLMAKEA